MQTFYLGTHHPGWLKHPGEPLFVSRRRLTRVVKPYRAARRWALDSGGFSELAMFGRWETTPETYAREAQRWRAETGLLDWAAIQDWMCEPVILAKTGLAVGEHQRRTIDSYERLRDLAPDVPWTPVLQGWTFADYMAHVNAYEQRGHRLSSLPVVGVGSVCRRQSTGMVEDLIRELSAGGLRIHGFGFKALGLRRVADALESSDSMAWSYNARRHPPMPGHTHKNCANCEQYAEQWRADVVGDLGRLNDRSSAQSGFNFGGGRA